MQYTDIAYIEPLDTYKDKSEVICAVKFMSGKFNQQEVKMIVPTDIFNFYFWGVTLEVVTYDDKFNCISVRDLQKEDIITFEIGVCYAMTYNDLTDDILSSNGFVYNLKDSLIGYNYPDVCVTLHNEICTSRNFALIIHTLRGAMVNVLLAKNLTEKDTYYKYALSRGFVPSKEKLSGLVPKTTDELKTKRVLTQNEIDKLIREMQNNK